MYKRLDLPFELIEVQVIEASDCELERISEELGLALNLNEMKKIQDYFRRKGRNPYDIELQSLGQAWSEHCCYKSSKYYLNEYITRTAKADYVISAIKEDAGVVEFDDEYAYVVAFESHNHPSAIEPYGGAATGIGGILRDVLCMGAQPIALVDPLFFGNLDTPYNKIPRGTKHPLYLFTGVVSGIRDYGNRVGIPTIAGMVFFDDGYLTNCIVNVGCIGLVRKDRIIHSKADGVGDLFVLVGGKTGRDGIHGVTFASAELDERSEEESRGAVQLGDPIMKEPLIHACLEVVEKKLLTGMKDLGGGGLSCVIGEMAHSAGFGAEIYLDKVPLKERGMAPWEIWISESQERMMLTVKPEYIDEVLYIFQKWDVPASVIGKVIEDKVLRIYYKEYKIYEMDIEFLVSGPEYCRTYEIRRDRKGYDNKILKPVDIKNTFLKMLSNPNVAFRDWVIRQYDHEVRGCTVVKPLVGDLNSETHSDAVVIKPVENSWRGLSITSDVNPWMCKIDPFWGAASSFDEMIRNLVAVNSIPHSFNDCLNFGNPEKPERMGEFVQSVKAIGWMARGYGIPCVSGNVSFYNETPYGSVAPTPTLLGIGIVEDIRRINTSYFQGGTVVLVGETRTEFGGSLYSYVMGFNCCNVPKTSPMRLKKYSNAILESFKSFEVLACHDVSEGGLAVALAEMSFGRGVGFVSNTELDFIKLFSESNTRWLIELKNEKDSKKYINFMQERGIKAELLGFSEGNELDFGTFKVNLEEADKVWRSGLSKYLA
ncbi:phosphoribosylformylglycinamidine synthase II [Archaeoglobales archaeon ex4484_92]|nr:MAG: phosphoribosylformylglycinamidine synthase II [Archaeoglobales archaeon ex4484_92]